MGRSAVVFRRGGASSKYWAMRSALRPLLFFLQVPTLSQKAWMKMVSGARRVLWIPWRVPAMPQDRTAEKKELIRKQASRCPSDALTRFRKIGTSAERSCEFSTSGMGRLRIQRSLRILGSREMEMDRPRAVRESGRFSWRTLLRTSQRGARPAASAREKQKRSASARRWRAPTRPSRQWCHLSPSVPRQMRRQSGPRSGARPRNTSTALRCATHPRRKSLVQICTKKWSCWVAPSSLLLASVAPKLRRVPLVSSRGRGPLNLFLIRTLTGSGMQALEGAEARAGRAELQRRCRMRCGSGQLPTLPCPPECLAQPARTVARERLQLVRLAARRPHMWKIPTKRLSTARWKAAARRKR